MHLSIRMVYQHSFNMHFCYKLGILFVYHYSFNMHLSCKLGISLVYHYILNMHFGSKSNISFAYMKIRRVKLELKKKKKKKNRILISNILLYLQNSKTFARFANILNILLPVTNSLFVYTKIVVYYLLSTIGFLATWELKPNALGGYCFLIDNRTIWISAFLSNILLLISLVEVW